MRLHRFATSLFLCALASAAATATTELVGPESCRTCHKAAYEQWSKSPHARARESLTADQRKQPLCMSCHSRDEQRAGQAQVVGVSCETCHGAGKSYQPEVVMRDRELARLLGLQEVTPQSCLSCHNGDSPSLKAFDAKEAMERIDHWSKGKQQTGLAPPAAPPRTMLSQWLQGKK